MLKFIKGHMDSIAGIELFPIITLIIFFTFFMVLFVWVFTYNKEKIKEMSETPLSED